uniref:Uncharacterized protein n=1 Tax=Panagrolaimus superbus TaxID=310955 RepID=A0A914YIR6_9BILA
MPKHCFLVYTCTATVDIPLDPTAPKTFVLAFPNYNSLIGPLFSGLLDKKPIIKLLRDYYNSYNPDYFNNFVLAPYTVNDAGTTAPNVKLSTTYDDFQQTFIDAYGNTTMTEPSPGALDQGFVINSLVNFAQIAPYSEIFIITNKLYNTTGNTNTDIYKSLANKRIKLNFLIYDDGTFQGFNDITLLSNFYDFAARSGGNVIPCDDVKAIEHFFDNYQGLQISQNSISSFDGSKEFAGIQSAGEFNYQTGKSYYIAATIKYASDGSPTFPWVQLQGKISTIQLNATVIIGRFYAKFLIPTSTPTDKYTVNILSGDLAPVFFVNVLEINPDHFYVIGFASEPTFDIQYTYPSYSGTGSRVYIVANAPDHDYSDVTIRYPYNKEFYTGEADERTNCKYNLITSNYTWQCSIPNQLYYITFDTSDRTHTEMFPCVSNGGSDTGNCQNGGQPDGNGNCVCPPGFMGPNCGDPVCYNGGTIQIDNTCRCSDYYTGEHCENALFSCQKDIPFPRFTSLLETFVLVVDLNLAPLPSIKPEDIPSVFQQYILVSAYQANGQDEALVQVYNNAQYFFTALSNLKPNSYPKDSRFAIRRALQAVKSDRSLVVWLSGATVLCGVDDDNPQPDDELLNLIAKRRVELRAFTKTQESACHRMISSYGNGVPLTYRNLENVFKYVNLLVPPTISDPDKANNNLVVVDSYITDDCQNIDVMLAIEKTQALPQYTNLHIILSNLEPAVGSTLTEIVTDLYDLQLTTDFTLKPQTPNTFCGYIVEALHPSRVAYEVTPSDNFEAEGYGVFYLAETTNLNIYFENGIEDDNFNNFPEVFTANVEYTNFTYEHAPVIRRQCTYPWSIEIMCDGFSGALKTKLIIKDSEKNSHQRLLTTYCIKKMTCSSYGRKLLTDDKDDDYGISQKVWTCGCSPLWYGTDCSIPICLNGGTPNRETCLCPNNYYGSNCEYQLLSSLFNYRLILIIYDVTGNDDQLESKKELVTEFINMYSQNNTNYYAFTTNVAGGPKVNVTNSASLILDAINAAVVSNKSIDLGQAFDFFNGQNLQVSLFQINGMFYITDSSVDPEQDFTTLFELQTKGFYLYSAYYYNNTDPSIPRLSDLSGLGGTTGAWNIYDILSDFSKFLHGGDLSVVPTPPITTTARPIPCVYNEIMDFTFFFDPVVSSTNYFGIFIYMRQFLIDLSSDLKFATVSEPDGSRAAFGVVNQSSGNLLCLSSAETLKDGATNVPFIKLLGNNNVNLSDVLRQANALMGPNARDHRNVPKFAVIITDRPIIDNLNEIVASAQKIKNETKIHFVVIGLGTGDFKSTYGKFAEQGMLYTIPDALEATQNAFKNKFYKDVCQVSNNLGHGDTSYDCQISKKSWPNLWI